MSCAVCFYRPGRVVLASDSCVKFHRNEHAWTETHRKLRHVGNWHYVIVGLFGYAGGRRDFFEEVEDAIAETTTIRAAMTNIHRAMAAPAAAGFRSEHEHGRRPRLEVFVGGLDGGRPVVGRFAAWVERLEPLDIKGAWGTSQDQLLAPDGTISLAVSLADGPAVELMKVPRQAWVEAGDVAAARRLIQLQCDATPDLVSRPIDIVTITPAGAECLQES